MYTLFIRSNFFVASLFSGFCFSSWINLHFPLASDKDTPWYMVNSHPLWFSSAGTPIVFCFTISIHPTVFVSFCTFCCWNYEICKSMKLCPISNSCNNNPGDICCESHVIYWSPVGGNTAPRFMLFEMLFVLGAVCGWCYCYMVEFLLLFFCFQNLLPSIAALAWVLVCLVCRQRSKSWLA